MHLERTYSSYVLLEVLGGLEKYMIYMYRKMLVTSPQGLEKQAP